MKRENFNISKDGILLRTKHAWNASNRDIESLVREIARSENQMYELVDKESVKDEDGYFIRGFRTWKGTKTGAILKFQIEKV